MKNNFGFFLTLSFFLLSCSSQKGLKSTTTLLEGNEYIEEIRAFQNKLNNDYLDANNSPLGRDKISDFKEKGGHEYFEINPGLVFVAHLDRSHSEKNIGFQTSSDRIAMYDKIGEAIFEYNSIEHRLSIYESHYSRLMPEYKDLLFLPFNDLTNGESTYGGGRYIDVKKSKSDKLIIDFNKSYNPYCAYSDNYSCPVPPKENFLNFEVNAGIKLNNE